MNQLNADLIQYMLPDKIRCFAQPFVGKVHPYKLVISNQISVNEYNLKLGQRDVKNHAIQVSNVDPIEFISKHNQKNTVLYVEPPCADQLLPTGDYEAIVNELLDFKGKVIFVGSDNGIYHDINHSLLNEAEWHNILAKINDRNVRAVYCNYPAKEQLNLL